MEEFHCRGCGRLLFKHDPAPIESGKTIELKCQKCKIVNSITASVFPELCSQPHYGTLDKTIPKALK